MPLASSSTAPPSESLPAVGELIAGKYRIERLIGKGAMGAVFAARHELLKKTVALKWIAEEHARTPQSVGRFFNEARAAAGIEGEHVARVLDVGQLEDGIPFRKLLTLPKETVPFALVSRKAAFWKWLISVPNLKACLPRV